MEVTWEAEGQMPDAEEEGVTSLAPSRGFWTAELCLGLPAEVDQHWSGGVTPSLTPLPYAGGGQPATPSTQTWCRWGHFLM